MRTPEEFASEVFDEHVHWGMQEWDRLGVLDLIRARDAEVRADERAKVLAGFEWQSGFRDHHDRDYGLHSFVRREDVPPQFTHTRRLVGPWEPTAGDDQP